MLVLNNGKVVINDKSSGLFFILPSKAEQIFYKWGAEESLFNYLEYKNISSKQEYDDMQELRVVSAATNEIKCKYTFSGRIVFKLDGNFFINKKENPFFDLTEHGDKLVIVKYGGSFNDTSGYPIPESEIKNFKYFKIGGMHSYSVI